MKIKKLMEKARAYLDSQQRDRKEKKKYLKQVLRKLSRYEKKLKAQLHEGPDPHEKSRLEKKLALVHEQRKKGVRQLKKGLD
jgi:flagellar motor switch protein FliM